MAANTAPIFVGTTRSAWIQTSGSAVTSTDGTDANVKTVFTAGANGARIENVYLVASQTCASAQTLRFWINNGSTAGSSANNSLIHEETFPATTVSTTAATVAIVWNAQLLLPIGYKLLVAGAVASQQINVTAIGGDF